MFDASSQHSPYQYSALDDGRRRTPLTAIAACLFLTIAVGFLGFIIYKQRSVVVGFNARLEQANAEAVRAKSDLARVAVSEADLRQQLVKAESGRAESEAEAARARGAGSALQMELAKAQGARAEVQAQLDRTKADLESQQSRVENLRSQLAQAEGRSSGQRLELAQVNGRTEALKEQLARAQEEATKPQVPPAPVAAAHPLPLTASFKKEFWSRKFKMQVKNRGSDPLTVEIAVTGSNLESSKSATIKAGKTYELGKLAAGADVTIASEGFEPVHLVVRK